MVGVFKGNLLEAKENLILHQVNCQAVMGSGVAKQIKEKWSKVFTDYKSFCYSASSPKELLGKAQFVKINDEQHVVNLFGQNTYGYNGKRFTNYEALFLSLEETARIARENNLSVAIPYKIGCDRGGANWNIVHKMIEELFNEVEVNIYKLK